jgi:hypothetical protein
MTALDLFGHAVHQLPRVRLARSIDRERPCCENLAVIHPAKHASPHAAESRCANCGKHRGWMARRAYEFLVELTQRYGPSPRPITLRDSTIGDHDMIKEQRKDSGVLFRNSRKQSDASPVYSGLINCAGTEYALAGWIKQGQKGKISEPGHQA